MRVKEKIGVGFLDLRICDNLELMAEIKDNTIDLIYRDWKTDRKSTRLNSSHSAKSRMPSSA